MLYILLAVYLLAVNVYSFMLVKAQKRAATERNAASRFRYGKLFLAGFLGGALAAYAALFLLKFKTDNLLLMLLLPLLIALNVCLLVLLLRNGFFLPQTLIN